ncbi:MAG: HDIG domain-containing protein [Opitutus sp.]|nr:HDIG domain-containing protein [Opitutus sp.]
MSVRDQLKLLLGGLGSRPRRRDGSSPTLDFLDRSRLVAGLIFIATVVAIVAISSLWMNTLTIPVQPNQIATTRVVANTSFSYESEEKTRIAREQLLNRVPPVYRLEMEQLQIFEAAARDLLSQLELYEQQHEAKAPGIAEARAELGAIAESFNSRGSYRVSVDDLAAILSAGDAKARLALFENGFAALSDLYEQGVQDGSFGNAGPTSATILQIVRPNGQISQRPVQSMEDALTVLRVNLASEGLPRNAQSALFRLFRNGLAPNLVFDREASEAREALAVSRLKPVVVNVVRGQTIIEPGERVTPEQYEMFLAQRNFLHEHKELRLDEHRLLFGRVLLVLAMVLASVIYIRIEDPETLQSNVRLGLLALVVIINLALVRANYSLGGAEFILRDSAWSSTLPYVAPTALAPLIVAILIDAGSAIFMALLISIFTGVIYGNRLDLVVITFLSSLIAIFFSRDAHQRGKVVRAAGAGGLTIAVFAALIAIAEQTAMDTLLRQMTAGVVTGLLTGIAVVGLLPVLESLFKRTTDITLLECTDYNHPLLRRMQMDAPGTYHHSLVVAQLAENAASAIGANALLVRTCALFHDIGKTAHAAFFTENQRDGINPHTVLTPEESARMIKQHVTDGVELARKHRLPRAVRDVIRQHHGTTLVRYFYHRAVQATQSSSGSAATVPEDAFRYDGPRPQFKESAIISLADGVEAASRSLREATPAQLSELIDQVVQDRIRDGQLDEAPLTFVEIARIKNSFQFTLLNMLHSRVPYPGSDSKPAQAKA